MKTKLLMLALMVSSSAFAQRAMVESAGKPGKGKASTVIEAVKDKDAAKKLGELQEQAAKDLNAAGASEQAAAADLAGKGQVSPLVQRKLEERGKQYVAPLEKISEGCETDACAAVDTLAELVKQGDRSAMEVSGKIIAATQPGGTEVQKTQGIEQGILNAKKDPKKVIDACKGGQ
jgi:hypothetical protein